MMQHLSLLLFVAVSGFAPNEADQGRLAKAGITTIFFHNRNAIFPERWPEHADLVKRYADGAGGVQRMLFAKTVIAKDYCLEQLLRAMDTDRKLQGQLPAALNRSIANTVIRELMGKEPSLREILNENEVVKNGVVDTVDKIREEKVKAHFWNICCNLVNTSLAVQVEAHYRAKVGNRPLPDADRLFAERAVELGAPLSFRHPLDPDGPPRFVSATLVQISYGGKEPLKNVAVVTRATMKPTGVKETAVRALIHGFNELFDPGADRNQVAALLLYTGQILHQTPQAAVAFVPVVEPGDVLHVVLFETGFYWDIAEARVSLFCNEGIFEKVVFRGGPHNDLNFRPAKGKPRPRPPAEKSVGPAFQQEYAELTLKPDADPFERCIPVGKTFLPVQAQATAEAGKPLLSMARNGSTYVALVPTPSGGQLLVLVPRKSIAKIKQYPKPRTPDPRKRP